MSTGVKKDYKVYSQKKGEGRFTVILVKSRMRLEAIALYITTSVEFNISTSFPLSSRVGSSAVSHSFILRAEKALQFIVTRQRIKLNRDSNLQHETLFVIGAFVSFSRRSRREGRVDTLTDLRLFRRGFSRAEGRRKKGRKKKKKKLYPSINFDQRRPSSRSISVNYPAPGKEPLVASRRSLINLEFAASGVYPRAFSTFLSRTVNGKARFPHLHWRTDPPERERG